MKFLLSIVFATMVSFTALAVPPSLVLVQYHAFNNSLTVTRGVGQTKTIELENLAVKKRFQSNAEQLYTLFSDLYAEDYTLHDTAEIGKATDGAQTVTYVFVKP